MSVKDGRNNQWCWKQYRRNEYIIQKIVKLKNTDTIYLGNVIRYEKKKSKKNGNKGEEPQIKDTENTFN